MRLAETIKIIGKVRLITTSVTERKKTVLELQADLMPLELKRA